MSDYERTMLVLLILPIAGKLFRVIFKFIVKLLDDRYKK